MAALTGASAFAASSDTLTFTMIPRDVWPPAAVADLDGTPGAEGQLLLQWTAPDGNNNLLGAPTSAAGYFLRVATFSIASVGGSTTTWWGLATPVQSLPPPAVGGNPPTPGAPGASDSLLLTQLEPGVTYYAAIVSSDAAGNLSDADAGATVGPQAQGLIADVAPATPGGLAASQSGPGSILVSWNAVANYDKDFYRVFVDSTIPRDFADAWSVDVDTTATSVTLPGLSTGTYSIRVVTVDKGAPAFPGLALQSAPSGAVTVDLIVGLPLGPFGIGLSTTATSAALSWQPVGRYANGSSFADPSAATCGENCSYHVYRATAPAGAPWTEQIVLSTTTLGWTDLASGPQYYYHVRAENIDGFSRRSLVRSAGNLSAYAVGPDDKSYLEIRAPELAPFLGAAAYDVDLGSRPQDMGGRVIQSLEIRALQGGVIHDPNMRLGAPGQITLHFDLSASTGFLGPQAAASAQNLSVFWHNGREFVQLYGRLDAAAGTLTAETPYFGVYQLRSVARSGSFSFSPAGVSNRFVTPNGDGKNDTVVFSYDNPKSSSVRARILDMRGATIVDDLPAGPIPNSKQWDGTASGRSVPGGIYIYQLEAEGSAHSGTIVILK